MGRARFDFAGEHVLVTGASRGIGLGIARGFARAGADVTLLANEPGVAAAAERLAAETGAPVRAVEADVADRAGLVAALADGPPVDVLVSNAGLERLTPLDAPDGEAAALTARMLSINVSGGLHAVEATLSRMGPGGRILFTASIWSRTAVPDFAGYCASKHGVLGLMRSLARELGPRGIRVNAVCPGWVRTEASLRSLAAMAARGAGTEAALLEEITAAQILPGLMGPEDVAGAYLWLASDAAASVAGQAVTVDRGEVMA